MPEIPGVRKLADAYENSKAEESRDESMRMSAGDNQRGGANNGQGRPLRREPRRVDESDRRTHRHGATNTKDGGCRACRMLASHRYQCDERAHPELPRSGNWRIEHVAVVAR